MVDTVVILAGGLGTRLAEDTETKPKPMIEIGGLPILWHIMKAYSAFGFRKFIVCLGYKGYVIKEYFANYFLHMADVTLQLRENRMQVHRSEAEDWEVTLIDTGLNTMTGGRLRRIRNYVEGQTFCLTYGDGVADINLAKLTQFHIESGRLATVTAVIPPGRFGALDMAGDAVREFREKPLGDGTWINGGFFVLHAKVIDYIESDTTVWEREPLERLAADGQLGAFRHTGFWHPMDTLRDKRQLEAMWAQGNAPWKVWND